jgi:nucleoside phosphorylase
VPAGFLTMNLTSLSISPAQRTATCQILKTFQTIHPKRLPHTHIVDYAVISILEPEFEAILLRFPPTETVVGSHGRRYNLCSTTCKSGRTATIVTARAGEQGNSEAQELVADLIPDLKPKCIILVGVAGARPSSDLTLGDVVASNEVADFRIEASLPQGEREFHVSGGQVDNDIWGVLANLQAYRESLEPWNTPTAVRCARPAFVYNEDSLVIADDKWQAATRKAMSTGSIGDPDRRPRVRSGPIGSSDRLIKDPKVLAQVLRNNRKLLAIEMEFAGAYKAARRRSVPIFTVRGISDVVGYERSDEWLEYACHTAASFTEALIRADKIQLKPGK